MSVFQKLPLGSNLRNDPNWFGGRFSLTRYVFYRVGDLYFFRCLFSLSLFPFLSVSSASSHCHAACFRLEDGEWMAGAVPRYARYANLKPCQLRVSLF